jgi:hypothetical protein
VEVAQEAVGVGLGILRAIFSGPGGELAVCGRAEGGAEAAEEVVVERSHGHRLCLPRIDGRFQQTQRLPAREARLAKPDEQPLQHILQGDRRHRHLVPFHQGGETDLANWVADVASASISGTRLGLVEGAAAEILDHPDYVR